MLTSKPRFPVRQVLLHGWWPSLLKLFFYRLKGYRIGRGVRLGFGTVILGTSVSVGDYVSIGFFTFVRGRVVRLGPHVQIGSLTVLDTPHLEIGEGTKINEQVFVGGLQSPDSRLVIGRNCQVMQMTFINPTRSIVIGDDTGIGGDCLLFGHTSWLSQFEGYPVQFDSIEIGNSVSLAWRVFVLPGTKIGDGAVVGANSLVRGTVPPRCLSVGFPARVVSREPEFPRPVSQEEKTRIFHKVVEEMIQYLLDCGFDCHEASSGRHVVRLARGPWWRKRPKWHMLVRSSQATEDEISSDTRPLDLVLSLHRLSPAMRFTCDFRGIRWLDVEAKERSALGNPLCEEAAMWLRRYGVRFLRVPTADKA